MILVVIVLLFGLWYLISTIQGAEYLASNKISMSKLSYLVLPFELFKFHITLFKRDKNRNIKYILVYFFNYKYTIIFFTELLLENMSMVEAVGYSPMLSKTNKKHKKIVLEKANTSVLEKIKNLVKLPETGSLYTQYYSPA